MPQEEPVEQEPIGLAELIEQVKRELLAGEAGATGPEPLFSVDKLELELHVTVRKEGKAGLRIHVVEFGGGISRDDVQVVKVSLTPLLSKEDRIRIFKNRYPERWQELEERSIQSSLKGSSQQPLGDVY